MKHLSLFILSLFTFTLLYAEPVPSLQHILKEKKYDVNFYFLDLDIEAASPAVSGNVLVRVKSLVNQLDTLALELDSRFTIDSVKVSLGNGTFETAGLLRNGMELNILLPFAASAGETVSARIYYRGTLTAPAVLTGKNHRFSMTCPYYAYTVFPCKQDLTDKADSSWFFITTDTSSRGLANGILTNVADVSGGKKRWEWKSKYPIDFYLISFVVGEFSEYTEYFHPENRSDSLLLKYYGYNYPKGYIPDILNVFSKLFGLYPFYNEKLGIANVNLGGGMENQTLIALNSIYGVEAHEIAHQWWGDNVTCGSYRDITLNEGFATWCESVYDEFTSTNPNLARINKCNSFETSALKQPDGSVYNHSSDSVTFSGVYNQALYYNKGAMVINSLRFEINNDSLFFSGLRNYQTQFGGKTALGRDLQQVMESSSGKNLSQFFNQWYYGYGYPTFSINWNQLGDQLYLKITQAASSSKTPLFTTSLEIKVKRTQGDTTVRFFIDSNVSEFSFTCPGDITGFMVDPNQWILNKTGAIVNDASTGVKNIVPGINPDYFIFPNPVSDYFKITTAGSIPENLEIKLFNQSGQQVFKGMAESNQQIEIPKLPNGIYLLQINKTNLYKILITHR